ncbi:uncharacterized protein LOC143211168 isoform X2 [Lasioglossum baleicum]|uniref:uncharacterized protein LOC143211168 isoform X2 n=1 Tax=Lasioglossum baleicum TaxID=434251 RepID=UPI003FCCFDE5
MSADFNVTLGRPSHKVNSLMAWQQSSVLQRALEDNGPRDKQPLAQQQAASFDVTSGRPGHEVNNLNDAGTKRCPSA